MSIGSRFRQLRQHLELSGEEMGELCGVTKGMVSQWESDTSPPTTERLLLLAKKHKFSTDWLLFGRGEMIPSGVYVSDPKIAAIAAMLQQERAPYLVDKIQKGLTADIELIRAAGADAKAKKS